MQRYHALVSTFGLLALVACSGEAVPHSLPHTKGNTPEWVTVSETETERFLTDRCWDLAPPEAVEFTNPDFRECFLRAQSALDRAWHRLNETAIRKCIETGQSCCFEKLPAGYALHSLPPFRVPGETFEERQKACDEECSTRIGRQPGQNSTCQPSVIVPPYDPEHHRTAAMRAVVTECGNDPAAVSKCALLSGQLTRSACEFECREAASRRTPAP